MAREIEVTDEFLSEMGHTRESYRSLSRSGRWGVRNREKQHATLRRCVSRNPEYYARRHRTYCLKQNYNITDDDYNKMLKSQNGRCAICGTNKLTGRWKSFAIDHNHITGKVRGLLCNECNRGIGYLKDDYKLLQKAVNYLIKNK